MTDGTWCPKHLRTIGALAPCELCAREAQGCNDCILPQDSCAYFNKVAALEKEVEDRSRGYNELYDLWIAEQKRASQLRADAERYRWLRDQRRWLYNLPPTPGISVRWENYIAGPSDWLDSAIDAQLAAMRTGEGA